MSKVHPITTSRYKLIPVSIAQIILRLTDTNNKHVKTTVYIVEQVNLINFLDDDMTTEKEMQDFNKLVGIQENVGYATCTSLMYPIINIKTSTVDVQSRYIKKISENQFADAKGPKKESEIMKNIPIIIVAGYTLNNNDIKSESSKSIKNYALTLAKTIRNKTLSFSFLEADFPNNSFFESNKTFKEFIFNTENK